MPAVWGYARVSREDQSLGLQLDRMPNEHSDGVLSRVAPIGHKHINLRGILKFDLAQYASTLLRPGHLINNERLSK